MPDHSLQGQQDWLEKLLQRAGVSRDAAGASRLLAAQEERGGRRKLSGRKRQEMRDLDFQSVKSPGVKRFLADLLM